ncbi:MAG TPA: HesB/YadR/YfhF-family protein [Acidimicrobiia bacterium]|nr:HesB/YadR/YfhF-family protein [Acidimicrobiia bacterium]
MLALTENATEAIEGILASPAVADEGGVRIEAPTSGDGGAPDDGHLNLAVVEAPAAGDHVIDEAGARVFLDQPVVDYLDDKVLDARVEEQRVSFVLGEQGQ